MNNPHYSFLLTQIKARLTIAIFEMSSNSVASTLQCLGVILLQTFCSNKEVHMAQRLKHSPKGGRRTNPRNVICIIFILRQ